MNEALFDAMKNLEAENRIAPGVLVEKVRQGILRAVKKEYPDCDNILVEIDESKRTFNIAVVKEVVEGEPENANQINIEKALYHDKRALIGKSIQIKVSPEVFGRAAASAAKQSLRNDIKEFEKARLLDQYKDKEHECISAQVVKTDIQSGITTLLIEKNEVYLFKTEQIPGEILKEGSIVKVYVVGIVNPEKKPSIKVSRTHKDLVKRLFEIEIPEIYDGTVEVKAISREAGSRTKIAVYSKNPEVDAVGACIGPKRTRISKIVDELNGEKIDIIVWSEKPEEFIAKALAPAEVVSVTVDENLELKTCTVIVPNSQLSLAIGNRGQNAKLAAKLTGYKIDIKPQNEIPSEGN